MAPILSTGFANLPLHRMKHAHVLALAIVGILFFSGPTIATAQNRPAQSHLRAERLKTSSTPVENKNLKATPVPVAAVVPEVPPPAPPAPVQTPAKAPEIAWDGKLLTIDAENSTLSDILLGIRARTGASVEMPPSASAERVAVHLGPAPVREVISSLLYGTEYDYLIQASESDEHGLQKVIITARGKGDDMSNTIDTPVQAGVRLMPGYSKPGKRDFEVAHEASAATSASEPVAEAPSSADATPAAEGNNQAPTDPSAQAQEQAPASTDSQAAPAESAEAGLAPAISTVPSSDRTMATAGQTAGETSSMSQMEQNLQRMYEQRRQIQAQQNQTSQQGK